MQRRKSLQPVFFLLFILFLAILTVVSAISPGTGYYDYAYMVCLVNEQRRINGNLAPLGHANILDQTASAHSQWMAQMNTMSHYENGVPPSQRISAAGVNWQSAGENIAFVCVLCISVLMYG